MTKRLRSKYKSNRRLGLNLWGRPKSPANRRSYPPGQHGQRRRKVSDYGTQLNAKQKLRFYYGNISESRFRRYYHEAARRKGDTSENLIGLLEQRLDSVIYRAKFVPTVFAARQFISHGHVQVSDRRVTISSYVLSIDEVVKVKAKSAELAVVLEAVELAEREVPDYLTVDHKKMTAQLVRIPKLDEVPYPVKMEPNLVIEYYSR